MSEKAIALVLAAGLGTRMKSSRAKVLHEVAGRPLVAWVLEAAFNAEIDEVVVVLGHQLEEVEALIRERYPDKKIRIAKQEEQKGTGHAVQCGLRAVEDAEDDRIIAILSGDAPLLQASRISELVATCSESESKMALLATHGNTDVRFGRLVREDGESSKLMRIVEYSDASEEERAISEMNAGFYAMSLGVLKEGISSLNSNNAQGEFYLTDLAEAAAARGGACICHAPFSEVNGVNTRADLAFVEKCARKSINEKWMAEGVSMQAPEQVFIDADVGPIGSDVRLACGVHLRGSTKVGTGSFIDAGVVLRNVEIAENTHVKPYSVLTDTKVGSQVQVGPFTHCRPQTRIDDGAKVGNFVETKKAHLMAGAKASHLSYLGDVSVGSKANIGAGTITCNYDGVSKHKTTIESGAFIGSDSQLVAPVTVGQDAYVGSGTTVTKDVPRSGLALSRVKQVNVDGWADRFRDVQQKRKKARENRAAKKNEG